MGAEVADLDFIALPKLELHAHLSGSISRTCLRTVWKRKKEAGETDLADPLIVMPEGKHDYDMNTFFPLFSTYIYRLVSDAASLAQTTRSVLHDFAVDGVVYLELRTTPRALPPTLPTKAAYVGAVLDIIAAFEAQVPRPAMHTKLILSIDRRSTVAEAQDVVALARDFQPRGVVGIDLCGDPTAKAGVDAATGKAGIAVFADAFRHARTAGLGLTVHFAEAAGSGHEAEAEELLGWWPDRLGHVIHLTERVRSMVRDRGQGLWLELCLSCNVQTGMVRGGFANHHFREWWREKSCKIVLCTDDFGVFGSPLSNEYALVAEHFGLDRSDICALARGGVDAIFGGESEKQRLREMMW